MVSVRSPFHYFRAISFPGTSSRASNCFSGLSLSTTYCLLCNLVLCHFASDAQNWGLAIPKLTATQCAKTKSPIARIVVELTMYDSEIRQAQNFVRRSMASCRLDLARVFCWIYKGSTCVRAARLAFSSGAWSPSCVTDFVSDGLNRLIGQLSTSRFERFSL
jgi:hypothetical protein